MFNLINRTAKSIIKKLSPNLQAAIFFQLAKELKVNACSVRGDNGYITGDMRDKVIFANYIIKKKWAPELIHFIERSFFASGGLFLDIGANVGLFSVPLGKISDVRVVAFEPDPINFGYLTSNVFVNGLSSGITLHNLALFDKKTELLFELSNSNFGDHRVRTNTNAVSQDDSYQEAGREVIRVNADMLDAVVAVEPKTCPVVAKIDVQGAEPMVWAGGRKVLSQADALIIEFWPYGIRRLGGEPWDFLAELVAAFPYMAAVGEDEPILAENFGDSAAVAKQIESLPIFEKTGHLDLIFLKEKLL